MDGTVSSLQVCPKLCSPLSIVINTSVRLHVSRWNITPCRAIVVLEMNERPKVPRLCMFWVYCSSVKMETLELRQKTVKSCISQSNMENGKDDSAQAEPLKVWWTRMKLYVEVCNGLWKSRMAGETRWRGRGETGRQAGREQSRQEGTKISATALQRNDWLDCIVVFMFLTGGKIPPWRFKLSQMTGGQKICACPGVWPLITLWYNRTWLLIVWRMQVLLISIPCHNTVEQIPKLVGSH